APRPRPPELTSSSSRRCRAMSVALDRSCPWTSMRTSSSSVSVAMGISWEKDSEALQKYNQIFAQKAIDSDVDFLHIAQQCRCGSEAEQQCRPNPIDRPNGSNRSKNDEALDGCAALRSDGGAMGDRETQTQPPERAHAQSETVPRPGKGDRGCRVHQSHHH